MDAEDLTQEVLTKVSKRIQSFDPNRKGTFRGWLAKLTRNLIVDRFRCEPVDKGSGDTGVHQMLGELPDADDTATRFDIEVFRARLQQACDIVRSKFAAEVWDAFWNTAILSQSIAEVAKRQNKSEGAVRVARCRVMARLKKEVAKDDCSNSL